MKRLRIGIIDLVTQKPTRALWSRIMNANLVSIMPQVIGVWCAQEGHDVSLLTYTGAEDLFEASRDNPDIVFISSFTRSAQLAYALSSRYRRAGTVTVLGGPHARCYPQDASRFFDYVLGFTDKKIIQDVLHAHAQPSNQGVYLSAEKHPAALPGVRARWPFIEQNLKKSPILKLIPMISSMGCPYSCRFCIDADVPYQPLDLETIREDLRFLLTKFKRPRVGWFDPMFGVQFTRIMETIREAVPPGSVDFGAECSLSLLTEPNLKALRANGFKAVMPGIESWFDNGNKSRTGKTTGMEKVSKVADHVNAVLRYIPYVQTNFVFGLDSDEGPLPFDLTKKFLEMVPAAIPAYSMLTSFGQAAPQNRKLQEEGRILPFPFHFLDNNQAMNIVPKNYTWASFYDRVIDVTAYSYSREAIIKRFRASRARIPRWLNLVRAVSSEGFGRLRYYRKVRRLLDEDPSFRAFFEQESQELPQFYTDIMKQDLHAFWQWLPEGAIYYDPGDLWHIGQNSKTTESPLSSGQDDHNRCY